MILTNQIINDIIILNLFRRRKQNEKFFGCYDEYGKHVHDVCHVQDDLCRYAFCLEVLGLSNPFGLGGKLVEKLPIFI